MSVMVAAVLVHTRWISVRASGPPNDSRPMWLMSNKPAAVRTAVCSSMIDVYCTGIPQPAKSTMRAPCPACQSYNGVRKPIAGLLFGLRPLQSAIHRVFINHWYGNCYIGRPKPDPPASASLGTIRRDLAIDFDTAQERAVGLLDFAVGDGRPPLLSKRLINRADRHLGRIAALAPELLDGA